MPKITLTLALAIFTLCTTLMVGTWTNKAQAGTVDILKFVTPAFSPYTNNPTSSQQQWMRDHFSQMLVFTPYFDARLNWYPGAWVYREAQGIDVNDPLVSQHPNWILRDAQGNKLFVPTACSNGSCPMYAADIGNPGFRAHWIAATAQVVNQGYSGIWMDDMVLEWRTSDGYTNHATFVQPFDPRTGTLMTLPNWRRYFAEFAEEVRAAFPNIEIGHNVLWFAGSPLTNNDPFVTRELKAADYITLERGVNDTGLGPGGGRWGFETYLAYVDFLHSLGRKVIFMDFADTIVKREYGLAGWLLIREPGDKFSPTNWTTPDNWWAEGYELDLGSALGARYKWNNLLRRDFDCGTVLLNQPGMSTQTVTLDQAYTSIEGGTVSSVQLDAATGIILRVPSCDNSPLPPPPPPPPVDPIVIDNQDDDTSRSGGWVTSNGSSSWAGDSLISSSGSVFHWWPDIITSEQYDVYAWWTYDSNRSTNVPYRIVHGGGLTEVTVNQRDQSLAGQWNLLGTFYFEAGVGSNHVEVSSENGQASADVVQLIPTSSNPPTGNAIVVDNQDAFDTSQAGTWSASNGLDPWASNSLVSGAGSLFHWWPDIATSRQYDVYAWWTYRPNRSTNVPYRIVHDGGVTEVTVNQRDQSLAGQWNLLGRFYFEANVDSNHVEVSSENGQASADAVRFVPR